MAIGGLQTIYIHHVAFRKLQTGIERYIFGPGGLCIHSVLQVEDKGVRTVESIPRETLYLEEKTEILCSKVFKWWFESQVSKRTKDLHESLRIRWDERFRADWQSRRLNEKVDLLA
jgi:hypothetical protein